ncbi:MAG TPA: hypothetical protein PLP13_06780 [bacterium]|nr:hypothetical protein [bacterium]
MKFSKGSSICYFLIGIILFVSIARAQTPGNYQTINGNPLRIYAYDDGTIGVYRYQADEDDYVEQYYGGKSWGSVLFLNGINGQTFNSWYFIDWHDSEFPQFTPVSNTKPNEWTIITIFDVGNTGVRIKQTISYTNGNSYFMKKWEITNESGTKVATTYTDCRFLHGGDTYFAGDDGSQGHWDENLGMVYLTNPDPSITGIMGFYGSLTTPADHYYEDYYSDVGETMLTGQLPDTVNPNYVDAGYALQWNRATLAPGETWTIVAFEKWTEAGFVQVFAPAEQTGNPGDTINYQFVVANYQSIDDTFDLVLTSSAGWQTSLPDGNTINISAGNSAIVNATVTIPANALPGATDNLTLTVTSQTDQQVTNQDSVTTRVPEEVIEQLLKVYGGGGGCFIATAAFGSYQEKHVRILRQFRDRYLMTTGAGRAFVRFYYQHSPSIARVIAGNNVLRAITRIALLPAYCVAYIMLTGKIALLFSIITILMITFVLKRKFSIFTR